MHKSFLIISLLFVGSLVTTSCVVRKSTSGKNEGILTCDCRKSALVVFSKTEREIASDIREVKMKHMDDSLYSKPIWDIYRITVDSLTGKINSVELDNVIEDRIEDSRIVRDLKQYLIELGPFLCIGTKNSGDKVDVYDFLIHEHPNGKIDIVMEMGVRWF